MSVRCPLLPTVDSDTMVWRLRWVLDHGCGLPLPSTMQLRPSAFGPQQ